MKVFNLIPAPGNTVGVSLVLLAEQKFKKAQVFDSAIIYGCDVLI